MADFKTPGVYIEEIPTLGASIAGVPTAIPGFVGYTETAIINGTQWTYPTSPAYPNGEPAPPVRITSLLEFMTIFGGAYKETFNVSLTGTVPSPTNIVVTPNTTSTGFTNYILFYQVQMFYANGGGTCWIVSADQYSNLFVIDKNKLEDGINLLEQTDEVTILCAPESVFLTTAGQRKEVYNLMVAQCAKLQDRFAVMDVVHNANNTIFQDASDFRNNDIGPDNLKYGASYYPALNTTTGYFYDDNSVTITDNRAPGVAPYNYNYGTSPNNTLSSILSGRAASVSFTLTIIHTYVSNDFLAVTVGGNAPVNIVTTGAVNGFDAAAMIVSGINSDSLLSQYVIAINTSVVPTTASFTIETKKIGTFANNSILNYAANPNTTFYVPNGASQPFMNGIGSETDTYNRIKTELGKDIVALYPSASMAGIYASVDASRGVWKAPANVGVTSVSTPSIQITDQDQENLNVDSVSGKSINAIRQFNGRGILVWGARTLAGNDNEWRYINVRRLFTYVEESAKQATEFVVFEPNTATTWNRVKSMIESFLTGLWRDGALAGATTKDAFFVNVGLGTTMTPDDILQGMMIVEIGMAAARPAEFIILRFEHKLQES